MYFFKLFLIQTFFCLNLFSNFLDQKLPEITLISKQAYEDLPTRKYEDIVLNAQKFGDIRFSVSYPKNLTNDENILLLLDGLETGRDSLKYVPHPDNYVIIGYEFQKELFRLKQKSVFFHLPSTRKAVLDVPFQLLGIVDWIKKQPWGKKNVIIIGVSFGAIFVPATYHLAEINNIELSSGIIAFGGAGLYDVYYANLRNYQILRKPLAYLASLVFKPIDPMYHLPYIHGKFLVINGTQDKSIPLKSARLLQELAPEPKTIINLDTPHLDPSRKDIINEVVEISLKWLEKNKN
ncbi:MAG: hypothetical protein K1060chlam3_00603 [Candidatus Anoxychlamydiales bacterium]|nr:hypothetical protein [Candidatus Anoxychlamydiales bacterium]